MTARICIVGGGSYLWGPRLVKDIAATPALRGSEVVLHDLDPEAARTIARLGRLVSERVGADLRITVEDRLSDALRDSEFVILTISTGGLNAMESDIDVPAEYGIWQTVGDTVGPGGWARSLRNIPVVVSIAKAMEEYSPDAWLLNYTNPMTTLSRAITKTTSIRCLGFCHESTHTAKRVATALAVPFDEMEYKVAGINHLIFWTHLQIGGKDGFAIIKDRLHANSDTVLTIPGFAEGGGSRVADHGKVKFSLFDLFGALPAANDRHVAEFFPYFLTSKSKAEETWSLTLTSIDDRRRWLATAKEVIARQIEQPETIQIQRSDEAFPDVIAALKGNGPIHEVVNLPNRGQVPGLPEGVVVESEASIDSAGVSPVVAGSLGDWAISTIQRHVENQEAVVESALEGRNDLAFRALANDPLIWDVSHVRAVADQLLKANDRVLKSAGF